MLQLVTSDVRGRDAIWRGIPHKYASAFMGVVYMEYFSAFFVLGYKGNIVSAESDML